MIYITKFNILHYVKLVALTLSFLSITLIFFNTIFSLFSLFFSIIWIIIRYLLPYYKKDGVIEFKNEGIIIKNAKDTLIKIEDIVNLQVDLNGFKGESFPYYAITNSGIFASRSGLNRLQIKFSSGVIYKFVFLITDRRDMNKFLNLKNNFSWINSKISYRKVNYFLNL